MEESVSNFLWRATNHKIRAVGAELKIRGFPEKPLARQRLAKDRSELAQAAIALFITGSSTAFPEVSFERFLSRVFFAFKLES